jgi:hypothetical protein
MGREGVGVGVGRECRIFEELNEQTKNEKEEEEDEVEVVEQLL